VATSSKLSVRDSGRETDPSGNLRRTVPGLPTSPDLPPGATEELGDWGGLDSAGGGEGGVAIGGLETTEAFVGVGAAAAGV
jgi:hypothetical protein